MIGERAMMLRTAIDELWPTRTTARRHLESCPHWVWPLAVCAVFIAVGILVVDDYAVSGDTDPQRTIVAKTVRIAQGTGDAHYIAAHRFYGVAFEILPFLMERVIDQDDTRLIYLSRHLLTHLLFIIGGFCCYLLAYRMTGSRLLGLFAMLLFLLHPRMYGHSFWNSKDLPFLSMFMIALLSVHWAFRSGTIGAFVVCGVAVAILVNLRIMGVMLLPAVLAMRACDVYLAVGWAERRRVVIGGAAFALAAAAIYYASMPYLWADPLGRFGELLATLSRHSFRPYELFQGQYVYAADLPALYLPVWMGITTPPWALLLAGLGTVGICWRAVRHTGAALRNTGLRFELLLGCAVLPVITVIALQPVMYNDWRQMYYLWAPLCLLAMAGLQQVGNGLSALIHRFGLTRHWGTGRNPAFARVGLAAVAALALAVTAAELIRLHPYQQLYFNLLVDRTTPEYLKTQYETAYVNSAFFEGYQYALDNHPGEMIQLEWRGRTDLTGRYLETFSESERRRFRFDPENDADYYILSGESRGVNQPGLPTLLEPPAIYSRAVYNNTIMSVTTPHLSRVDPDIAEVYREIYRAALQQEPALRADFDFYLNGKTLTLVNEDCPPGALSRAYRLLVYPIAQNDLPGYARYDYVEAMMYGIRFDGKCLMQATLPNYDIARIAVPGTGAIVLDGYLPELRRQYAALQETEPAIRSDFAVYARQGELRYARDECSPDNKAAPFYLHIIPANMDNLSAARREYGYDSHDFTWDDVVNYGRGIAFDGKCMATVPLPDYAIHGIRTGQYVPGGAQLWSGEFYTDAYFAAPASELAAQDFYDVYYGDGALTYMREDCAATDTAAPFFLHIIPSDVNNLPEGRQGHGFNNLDFEFGDAGGVQYAGRCLVQAPLPDYAIDRIQTGQYRPDTGRLWETEFAGRPSP